MAKSKPSNQPRISLHALYSLLPMKKFILWDNDGVLVDTEYWYFKATQRALAELNFTLERNAYLQRMVHGESSWDLAIAAGIERDVALAKRQQRDVYYQEYLEREDIEIPGVEPVLKDLAKNHRMAIVTTSRRADFDLIHRHRNIVNYMEFVLAREDYAKSKPDSEPYRTGLQRFGASAEHCLVVEDSQRGLQSALAAGIDCAIVHNHFTASHDFSGARYTLNSIAELPALLADEG
jgi:HAD superfamily hydrolase (TIGR01509 family)